MKFTDLFIKRPVLAMVVSLVIIIAGLQAIGTLNVRQYPQSDNATVTITTTYLGASPQLVRGFITTPLERAIAAADGIDYIQSSSEQSVSIIQARLKLNFDATSALAEISSKVDQVRRDLPPEAEVPVINVESADGRFASAYLTFSSDILQQNEITDYLVRAAQPRFTAIEGVQRAEILGGRTFAMRIWLKPDRMASLQISPGEVRQALAANNYLSAVGQTKGSLIQVNLTANTDLRSREEFEKLVVREQDGVLVRLEDIAHVVLGAEDYDTEVRFSGQTAVFMGIFVLPNANSVDVIGRVREEMASLQRDLPSGIEARIAYDGTEYINDAVREVVKTLGETLLIIVIVIFLFLGSLRSVIIPAVAIPISLIGAVFLMQIFGFTINLLTLLAIVLAVGIVVDDAIVVVENIERHMREGKSAREAAFIGARELSGPIIAMTITLAAVYAPLAFQGGLTGTLFREFAFTLAGAVLISGVVALTLSPVMAAHMLKPGQNETGFATKVSAVFEAIKRAYSRLLDSTLSARPAIYLFWIFLTLLIIPMFLIAPKELAPTEDQGVIFIPVADAPANSTIDQAIISSEAANRIMLEIPEARHTFQLTRPNAGFGGLVVQPWSERNRTIFDILPDVQQGMAAIPGVTLFPVLPPALPGGGDFPIEFLITSTAETTEILEFAQELANRAMASGMFIFLNLDTKIDQPQSEIVIDRDKVADLGLNLQQVGTDLAAAMGGNFVNRFNIDGRSYKVIPQIERIDRLNPEQLQDIHITGRNGQVIPLSAVANLEHRTIARSLNRFQQLNAVKMSGVAMRPLGQALTVLEEEAALILPAGYGIDYTGESRQLRVEGNTFIPSMLMAIVLIFLVLAAQFNSFRDPLVILLGSVPLAIFGAFIFIALRMPNPNMPFWTDGWTTTFNIYTQVGLVTLVGLVAKNGILIVEFANQLQRKGLSKLEATRQASLTRLRPVLMTSFATVFAHFPLLLVTGAGAAARNSIGLVIVAGMTLGTLFTLLVLPSIYMLIARDHRAAEEASSRAEADRATALPEKAEDPITVQV
jgi:multidrug efflux pump